MNCFQALFCGFSYQITQKIIVFKTSSEAAEFSVTAAESAE
jgi:hypothetical protein